MKTFPIMISKQFMAKHPKRGEPTEFRQKILAREKIHTIRDNYAYWARIAEEVNSGRGVLSLRQWTKSPYNYARDGSKQEEFLRLEKMCVQNVYVYVDTNINFPRVTIDGKQQIAWEVERNDGFSAPLGNADFCAWFKKPLNGGALIHFTDFRYV